MTTADGLRVRLDELLDEYRTALPASPDDLTEDESRAATTGLAARSASAPA